MKSLSVLTGTIGFEASSLVQVHVAGGKGVIHLKGGCKISRHKPVLGAGHPVVQLGNEEEIALTQPRMFYQCPNDAL